MQVKASGLANDVPVENSKLARPAPIHQRPLALPLAPLAMFGASRPIESSCRLI
jgi:hypothetical protein